MAMVTKEESDAVIKMFKKTVARLEVLNVEIKKLQRDISEKGIESILPDNPPNPNDN